MPCKLFNNCIIFHLLTVFPINAAEQERYYITNVLKKSQRVNVCQFVCCVEHLNVYIPQILCFYYSPNANASTKPKNIPFTVAKLGSHVLRMCDDISLDRPDPCGTEDRPQSQAPLSYSIAAPSDHN
jgi:hypothetical protein